MFGPSGEGEDPGWLGGGGDSGNSTIGLGVRFGTKSDWPVDRKIPFRTGHGAWLHIVPAAVVCVRLFDYLIDRSFVRSFSIADFAGSHALTRLRVLHNTRAHTHTHYCEYTKGLTLLCGLGGFVVISFIKERNYPLPCSLKCRYWNHTPIGTTNPIDRSLRGGPGTHQNFTRKKKGWFVSFRFFALPYCSLLASLHPFVSFRELLAE